MSDHSTLTLALAFPSACRHMPLTSCSFNTFAFECSQVCTRGCMAAAALDQQTARGLMSMLSASHTLWIQVSSEAGCTLLEGVGTMNLPVGCRDVI
jgi:hypothetical protein